MGDPFSDPYNLHSICEKNFHFDRENFDEDGVRNDLDSQCYMHCLLGTIGVIDNEQRLHIDVLMPGIDDASLRHLSTKCGTLSKSIFKFVCYCMRMGRMLINVYFSGGSNICETAYLMSKCIRKEDVDYVCSENEVKCSYFMQIVFFLSFQWKK